MDDTKKTPAPSVDPVLPVDQGETVTNPASIEEKKSASPDISVDDILGIAPIKEDIKVAEPPTVVKNDVLVPENDVLVTGDQLPVISNQQPVTSDQRSATSNQSPATNYRPQVTSYQPPTTSFRPPVNNYQSNTYQPPFAGQSVNRGFVNPRTFVPRQPYEIPDANLPTETISGVLDVAPLGHGYLRPNRTPSSKDVYVSMSQIRRFNMRPGDMITGQARQPKENERYWGLLKVEKVNEIDAEQNQTRPVFDDLTPIFPDKQLTLEFDQAILTTRMVDLFSPIGMGQRGLVVSPPKAGKTWLLKDISTAVAKNYPEVMLLGVLIGERPEEVTDITRNVHGEVYASNFDESPEHQTRVAEVALDRAKRLIEMGHDVVILLDSITRLARAYNLVVNPSGRTLTGGFDPAALYPAKKFLGAARCNEPFLTPEEQAKAAAGETPVVKRATDGGSLTIIGTALVETGSRMDDLIYEEFKGTGNMELHLSRALQERRVFPAIDVGKSGTRHDELLLGEDSMKKVTTLRHMLSLLSDEERTQMLIDRLGKTKDNAEFLESLSQG